MSSKSDITPSIIKLKALRQKLCASQDAWKKAFEVRDFVISEITALYNMLDDESISRDVCLKKSKYILDKFLIQEDIGGE